MHKQRNVSNREFETVRKNNKIVKIINKCCYKYKKTIPKDDLYLCGLYGLWKCLKYNKPNNYDILNKFINWECLTFIRQNKNLIKTVCIHNIKPIECQQKSKIDVREYIDKLPVIEQKLIYQYFFEYMTMKSIGKENNCSKQSISQHIGKILYKLRCMIK